MSRIPQKDLVIGNYQIPAGVRQIDNCSSASCFLSVRSIGSLVGEMTNRLLDSHPPHRRICTYVPAELAFIRERDTSYYVLLLYVSCVRS